MIAASHGVAMQSLLQRIRYDRNRKRRWQGFFDRTYSTGV